MLLFLKHLLYYIQDCAFETTKITSFLVNRISSKSAWRWIPSDVESFCCSVWKFVVGSI